MLEWAFDLAFVQSLLDHRTPVLTLIFQAFTFAGEIEGYVLLVCLIHVAYNKALATRLAVVALVTMSLNHLLKTILANPRPFVEQGTHLESWAVSAAKAAELAAEFSTPSGHAMASAAFYFYLCANVKNRFVWFASLVTVLMMGLSRPYLGVHYGEDVLLGWAIGLPIGVAAAILGVRLEEIGSRVSVPMRALLLIGASAVICFFTLPLYEASPHGLPRPFVSYLGFLTGILVAFPIEESRIGFEPRDAGIGSKAARLVLSVGLVFGVLLVLDVTFSTLAEEASLAGNTLRFTRYALAAAAGLLVAPALSVKLGIAARRVGTDASVRP